MTLRQRAEQKESVRRFLRDNIRNDWAWTWPPTDDGGGDDDGDRAHAHRLRSPRTTGPDLSALTCEEWVERREWESDAEDREDTSPPPTSSGGPGHDAKDATPHDEDVSTTDPPEGMLAHRDAECNDTIRVAMHNLRTARRKRRHLEQLREELAHNDGLRCFIQRQQAWTCARFASPRTPPSSSPAPPAGTIVVDFAPDSPACPSSPITNPPGEADDQHETPAISSPKPDFCELQPTLIPIAPPLIPTTYTARQLIGPPAYDTIYLKVVSAGATPNVPINLAHVVRACVQGWKNSGEWPPRPGIVEPGIARRRPSRVVEELFGGAGGIEAVGGGDASGTAARRVSDARAPRDTALKGFGRGIKRMLGMKSSGARDAMVAAAAVVGRSDGNGVSTLQHEVVRGEDMPVTAFTDVRDPDEAGTLRASTEKTSERERT